MTQHPVGLSIVWADPAGTPHEVYGGQIRDGWHLAVSRGGGIVLDFAPGWRMKVTNDGGTMRISFAPCGHTS